MDRKTLLKSSRTTFVSIFNELMDGIIRQSMETLFEKADKSLSSQEQRQLLDARNFIMRNEKVLAKQIATNLDILLDRSFQTAYDTFRPSFFNASKSAPLMLLDVSTFENDLRLDLITANFRSEAGGQLRDLNIRVAILFEREDIAERENPFRPYILTRAIVLGVEAAHVESDLLVILTDQFAEELLRNVTKLYEGVNKHLSDEGVAAQLQYKPRQPYGTNSETQSDDEDTALANLIQGRKSKAQSAPRSDEKMTELRALNQFARIEQLLNAIKHPSKKRPPASNHSGGGFPEINSDLLEDGSQLGTHASVGDKKNNGNRMLGGVQDVGQTLRRVFIGGEQHNVEENQEMVDAESLVSDDVSYLAISPQLKRALQTPLPSVDELLLQDGIVRNLLIEGRDQLNSLANDQHEKMTIDIVAMLFEFILNDHQVPAEVRAQLGRLQFSVLKMALMDSALLTKKSHPARLLVNRIGSISVGLKQIDPTGERTSTEICQIVEELLASDAESPELFIKMLDKLDGFIAKELLASDSQVEHAIHVVTNAESRSQRFKHINEQLEKLLNDTPVTDYLRQFLLNTWAYAIERTERDSDVPATRFRLLVPKLVWSVLPKTDPQDKFLLVQILPSFVAILREGMSLVGRTPLQQQELLNKLVDIHTAVMRNEVQRNDGQPVLTLREVHQLFHDFVYPENLSLLVSTTTDKKVVQRSFVDEAIQEHNAQSDAVVLDDLDRNPKLFLNGELSEEANQELIANLNVDPESFLQRMDEASLEDEEGDSNEHQEEDILDRLRSGVMVEINLSGTPTHGRLNWISPNSSNLILTLHGEAAPSVISVRMFRRMLKNSRARFVEVAPLFERAVQSLLESADLVDLAHSS